MTASILVVCTGNICRSAYAHWRLADLLPDGYSVSSAGVRAVVGGPIHPFAADVLARAGGSADDHSGRQLTKDIARQADLVLAMTREHRTAIVQLAPACLRTAYTLREVERLLPLVDTRALPTEPHERLRALVGALRLARGQRPAPQDGDDVPDPIGLPLAAYEQMAAEIDPALTTLAKALAPNPRLS